MFRTFFTLESFKFSDGFAMFASLGEPFTISNTITKLYNKVWGVCVDVYLWTSFY